MQKLQIENIDIDTQWTQFQPPLPKKLPIHHLQTRRVQRHLSPCPRHLHIHET